MKKQNETGIKLWYALIQIMVWGGYGVIICYCSNFLKSMKFLDSHVSMVMGTASVLALVVQLLLAELIERTRFFETSKMIAGQGIMIFLAGIFMLQNTHIPVIAVLGIAIGCIAVQTLPSLSNSLATESEQSGKNVNFPVARGMGSLAYSLLTFLAGRFIEITGIHAITLLMMIAGSVLCLSAVFFQKTAKLHVYQDSPENSTADYPEKPDSTSIKIFFQKYRFLVPFLIGSTLLYINHNLLSTFMQQITEAKGAGATEQGTAIAIAGMLELPAMFGFSWLLKKASCVKWIRFSGICFFMKALIILLAPNYIWLYIAQIFQMGGFALYTVGSVEYVGSRIEAHDAVRAQTYLATTITAGALIALYFGGFICQYAGVSAMVCTAAVLALLGFLFVCKATSNAN